MRLRNFAAVALFASVSLVAACENEPSDDNQAGDGDGDGTGDGDGDGDGDSLCEELAGGDALIPGDCQCVDPGEPCSQGCFFPDNMKTCAEVCAELGETCVENGCGGSGFTYLEGTPESCPAPSEYGGTEKLGCDEPVPIIESPDDEASGASCCCTQS